MAKFIYRMQNILSLDEKLEEQAKMEYASQQLAVNEASEMEQSLKDRRASYEAEARRLREETLSVRDIVANNRAVEVMGDLITAQHEVVLQEEKKLEVKRAALQEAMKDRKTQEKLKEKAFEEFKAELLMDESKEIDQLTSYTYGIKKTDGKE